MLTLSNIISKIKPSPTLAASAKAAELKAQGKDIISLTVGEPNFDTPEHVKEAAREAIAKGLTKYTAVEGILPLRQKLSEKLKRDLGVDYSTKQIIVTNGGKQALTGACVALMNPGDEAIIIAPYWTSYPDMAMIAGGVPVIVKTEPENGYEFEPEKVLAAITPRTKVIFLNSPSNPAGAFYSAESLKALAKGIMALPNKDNICILSDEVYESLVFGGEKVPSIATVAPELRDNIVVVNAFSKSYSMTGWRIGYAAGPEHVIAAMVNHQSQFTSNVSSITQYAAVKAFDDNGKFARDITEQYEKNLGIIIDALKEIPGVKLPVKPRGGFFAFLRIEELLGKSVDGREINSSAALALYLLEEFGLAVVQGDAFGDPGAIRLSYAVSEEQLKDGLARLKTAADRICGRISGK